MTSEENESESLGQRALDVLVFAPIGLMVTALDEFPSLVAKGRERLDPHFRSAHAVGRLTVDYGAKELGRRTNQLWQVPGVPKGPRRPSSSRPPAQSSPRPSAPATPAAAPPVSPIPASPGATSPAPAGAAPGRPSPSAPSQISPRTSRRAPTAQGANVRGPAAPHSGGRATVDMAIPGYDALSASQVVRRLDGLGDAELDAVERYEENSRGRRTILHRIQQIRDGRSGGESTM